MAWERLLEPNLQNGLKKYKTARVRTPLTRLPRLHAEFLAFDPRTFSSLLTREPRIWFYARHHNFVGLTYFVLSVEFRSQVDADWSRSCTDIAGLWTHVHSFPLAAFVGCVGVAFLVLLLRFLGSCWFRQLALVQFARILYSLVSLTPLPWRLRSPCRARLQRKKKQPHGHVGCFYQCGWGWVHILGCCPLLGSILWYLLTGGGLKKPHRALGSPLSVRPLVRIRQNGGGFL